MKILVLEDDARILRGLRFRLDGLAHLQARYAASVAEAAEILVAFMPDVALVDFGTIAVARRFEDPPLQALFGAAPGCVVILTSGQSDPPDGYAVRAPQRLWLPKPFGLPELAKAAGFSLSLEDR